VRFAAAAGVFFLISGVWAQGSKPTEYQVKATYLYNFTQFVQWPRAFDEPRNDAFSICILGEDPFHAALNATIAGETVYGRQVVVARVPAPQDALACRILFISASEADHLQQILSALRNADVLTVSDMPYFTQRGGMIQFTMDGNRIRFAVNLASAREAGLILSSELLKLAVSVRRASEPGH
jgi:hypothetical protein